MGFSQVRGGRDESSSLFPRGATGGEGVGEVPFVVEIGTRGGFYRIPRKGQDHESVVGDADREEEGSKGVIKDSSNPLSPSNPFPVVTRT